MLNIISNSKSSMSAQQKKLDIISNNIANVNTSGYKKNTVEFQDLLADTLVRRGVPINEDKEGKGMLISGTGVRVSDIKRDLGQGMLQETGRTTDFAIDGEGFFQVQLADETYGYTRDGSFMVDSTGLLTDSSGNRVVILDESGKNINTPGSGVNFSDGKINVDINGNLFANFNNKKDVKIGKLSIKNFSGDNSLRPIGRNVFAPADGATPTDATGYNIFNGFIETSNVRLEEEMTDMIVTQRAFQVNASSLKTADEMWGLVNNMFK
ncbi:flagellar hook-basal body complex protein [Oceanirhabdus sp. W0125-5]|uniref:flagellar hook-basal body complex protein n=1 Tax=Oceanirhabdus sp. W0125-5 TaxID=2999116 RepID=UPI0022F2C2CB|nr:flagellar hook-basal body complex protein [Oceanirhabdus sp. W0125-5]WBW95407.1 flagellar hook-basal body complex protein [Oceanirhabdus sp. W0125-5]